MQHSSHSGVYSDQTSPTGKPFWIKPLHFFVLFCFDAAFFGRLYVIRVAQAFVSSFLFEVFISNISVGLFGTCIFDHSLESFVSQSGPFHYKEHSANSEGVAPLVHKSAAFSSVQTCCHCDGSVNICISLIRLATNGQKSLPRPRIHHRTFVLSE